MFVRMYVFIYIYMCVCHCRGNIPNLNICLMLVEKPYR